MYFYNKNLHSTEVKQKKITNTSNTYQKPKRVLNGDQLFVCVEKNINLQQLAKHCIKAC